MSQIIGNRGDIPLVTRAGTQIPNERRQQRHPQALQAAATIHTRRSTVHLRSATAVYNCVGLVFASRRTCIDTEHITWILEEDGYYKVDNEKDVMPGDLVLYRTALDELAHIAIVLDKSPVIQTASWKMKVLSQWGADGEYIHDALDIPELLGRPTDYWSERKRLL